MSAPAFGESYPDDSEEIDAHVVPGVGAVVPRGAAPAQAGGAVIRII